MALVIAGLVFCVTFLLAFLAVVVARPMLHLLQRHKPATETAETGLLRDDTLSTITLWDRLLTRLDVVAGLNRTLEESGLTWSVGRTVAAMMLLGAVSLAAFPRLAWMPLWAALLLSAGLAAMPYLLVVRARERRFSLIEEQFPDALESLASAMRAGHPLSSGMLALAAEQPEPLAAELRRVCEERRLGASWDDALESLAGRLPLVDIRLFVASVRLQTRTGGNLGEVLTRLAETMRDATALRGEVRAIAAHGKLTGAILTVLPLALCVIMTMVNPGYVMILVNYEYGKHLIAAALCGLVAAHFVIQRIVKVEP